MMPLDQKFHYLQVYELREKDEREGEGVRALYIGPKNEEAKDLEHQFIYRNAGNETVVMITTIKDSGIVNDNGSAVVRDERKAIMEGINHAFRATSKDIRRKRSKLLKMLKEAGL